MHVGMIICSLLIGTGIRWLLIRSTTGQSQDNRVRLNDDRYGWKVLSAFLIPPLGLIITAIALVQMGPTGRMLGIPVGYIGFVLGLGFLCSAGCLALVLGLQGWRSLQQIRTHPCMALDGYSARILKTDVPFAGQVGFWSPELVISQSLLELLTPEQVSAVLAHEKAHDHYHDTFWFFWLGWLSTLTAWLPQTQVLWHELLLLREMRADQWATRVQSIDPMILAESLLQVVRRSSQPIQVNCATVPLLSSTNRLNIRVDVLLSPQDHQPNSSLHLPWHLCIVLWPLLAIALHH